MKSKMLNPAKFFQMKMLWDKFTANHPKFPKFLQAAMGASIGEGTVIEVKITKPNGDSIASNIRLTQEDMELFREIKNFSQPV